jgi:hypothetical protein
MKLDIDKIKSRKEDYKFNLYKHGGSRSYIDGDSGDRQLMVDTYLDADFAKYIDNCTRSYFGMNLVENEIRNRAMQVMEQLLEERERQVLDMITAKGYDIENTEQLRKHSKIINFADKNCASYVLARIGYVAGMMIWSLKRMQIK